MKKNATSTWRRVLALSLCMVMLLSVLLMSGCSKKEDPAPSTDPATSDPAQTPAEETPAEAGDDVQTEPVVFVVRGISDRENKTDNEAIYQMIREKSGIDFELRVIPTDSWQEQVNLMIIGGEKWDVLNITEDQGDWSQYHQKSAIKGWNDYLQYMPTYASFLTEDALKGMGTADGTIYALPRHEQFYKQFVPAIRQDWLDALGMECPTTMAELEAYYEGVLTENLNGSDNEIPMMTFMLMENTNLRPFYLGFYGDRYLTDDGTILPWYKHENCYLLLEELNKWYTNGWLYSEYQTMAITDGFDLISADRVGGWTGPYNAGVSPSATILQNDPDSAVEWVSLDNFTDFPAGGSCAWGSNPAYQPELVLNTSSENAKWAAKLIDWIVSDKENWMLCTYGREGMEWEWTDESKTEFKLLDGYADRYLGLYMLTEWYDDAMFPTKFVNPESWKDVQVDALQSKINTLEIMESCDWFVPYDFTGTEAEFLAGDSETIINEACAKIVTGEWGEEEWNQAVETAWNSEGNVYSNIWTEQYHAFVG